MEVRYLKLQRCSDGSLFGWESKGPNDEICTKQWQIHYEACQIILMQKNKTYIFTSCMFDGFCGKFLSTKMKKNKKQKSILIQKYSQPPSHGSHGSPATTEEAGETQAHITVLPSPTHQGFDMGVNPKIGGKPPKLMVKIMETPIKMDDLGGKHHYFWVDTHI